MIVLVVLAKGGATERGTAVKGWRWSGATRDGDDRSAPIKQVCPQGGLDVGRWGCPLCGKAILSSLLLALQSLSSFGPAASASPSLNGPA